METAVTHPRFTRVEAEGKHLVLQQTGVIDGKPLDWTRDHVADGEVSFAGAQAAVAKLNADKYAGFDDWRLPTVEELCLLADRTKSSPAIDTKFFPDCESSWYWSGTVYESSPSVYAWLVSFYGGYSIWLNQSGECFVRAVRSSQ